MLSHQRVRGWKACRFVMRVMGQYVGSRSIARARNAMDGETAAALADAFRRFDADNASAIVILSVAGDHFCAGAALTAVASDDARRGIRRSRPLQYSQSKN